MRNPQVGTLLFKELQKITNNTTLSITEQVEALYLSNREFREKFDRIEHFAYSEAGNDSLMKLFIELLDKAHVSEHERVRYVNRFLELKIE